MAKVTNKNESLGIGKLDKKIDALAEVVKAGFVSVDEKIDALAMATKRGFDEVENKFVDLKQEMSDRFDRVDFSMNTHEKRIEILEDRVRQVAVKVGLRFN